MAQADSGPGRTRGAEHQVHGLAAHLAGDRGDLVLTGSRRLAGTTAAWRRDPPVPGDAESCWHAPDENGHVGPAAAHAVRGTPDAPTGGNDHRNEPGAHIETARLPLVGDGVHRETRLRARLVPVLRRRQAKRHGPGSARLLLPRAAAEPAAPAPPEEAAWPADELAASTVFTVQLRAVSNPMPTAKTKTRRRQ